MPFTWLFMLFLAVLIVPALLTDILHPMAESLRRDRLGGGAGRSRWLPGPGVGSRSPGRPALAWGHGTHRLEPDRAAADPADPRWATCRSGGGAPVTVQSMTTTKTADVDGTLSQIYALAAAGADIVRCTCNEEAAAEGLARIVPRSPVPIIADIHFHVEMALAALEAGVQGLRLNPGNLRKPHEIKLVAAEAKDRGVPIRIGVNAGSLHPDLYKKYGGATPEALVESARMELAYFAEVDFDDVKISVKASSVPTHDRVVPAGLGDVRLPAPPRGDRGRPAAGRPAEGDRRHRHAAGRGHRRHHPLLADRRPGGGGPGRSPAARGPRPARAQGARPHRLPELRPVRDRRDRRRPGRPGSARRTGTCPIQVAVMGCVVNGPGEAREADLGIAAGRKRGHLFIKGKIVRVVPEDEMVEALVAEAERLVAEGVEARLAAADAGAEAEAEADRRELLDAKGDRCQRLGDQGRPDPQALRRRGPARRLERVDRAGASGRAPSPGGPTPGSVAPVGSPPMRMSRLLVRTLREAPADAEVVSHQLLVRGGFIRRLASGVYSFLPLGLRVLHHIEDGHPRGARCRRLPGAAAARPPSPRAVGAERTGRRVRDATPCRPCRSKAGAARSCSGPPTRRWSPSPSGPRSTPTASCPSPCTRSRSSSATRPAPGSDSCAPAS